NARFERRLHAGDLVCVQATHFHAELVQYRGMVAFVRMQQLVGAIDIELATLDKLAVQALLLDQLSDQAARALQDRRACGGGMMEIAPIAAPGEAEHPARTIKVDTGIEVKRCVRS